ncbi:MAG: rRNA maturation RNase YbeY [Treponema sp.]|nr:rRNA maturation RNase YbeY [Treponema sp.]MBD5400009.1 rRNA maturation RNase YbeY [Treponema sp.]
MDNRVLVSVDDDIKKFSLCDEKKFPFKVERFLKKAMECLHFDREEISVLFCTDSFIQELNKNYRGIDSVTDVLSFENGEEYEDEDGAWICSGDIAISLETVLKNADYFKVEHNIELKRVLIHGLLHLNGFDHGEEHIEMGVSPSCEMLVLQEKILQEFADFDLWN